MHLFTRPIPLDPNASNYLLDSGKGLPLAGGPLAFSYLEIISWDRKKLPSKKILSIDELNNWLKKQSEKTKHTIESQITNITSPRVDMAGFSFKHPCIMAILNLTPDSFYDGGKYMNAEEASEHARKMTKSGADMIDIGGESTRPGASPINETEELKRILPVLKTLVAEGIKISVDTRHAITMAKAADCGAMLINDVSALSMPNSLETLSKIDLPIVLMHSNADPSTMQDNPTYNQATLEVYEYLEARINVAKKMGINKEKIIIDPGIGFGKNLSHNLEIIKNLSIFHGLGCPILLGASRKSFIGKISRELDPNNRLAGSIASVLWGISQGAQIFRVHDVAETLQATSVWKNIS